MRIVVTEQPVALVGLEEMKTALGESGSDRNALITGLIMAAQGYLDGPKGIAGVAVAEQSVDVFYDDFACPIYLPGITIISPLTSVSYAAVEGTYTDIDAADYALQSNGRLALAGGATWPRAITTGDAVKVSYDLGISEAGDPRIEMMRAAIMMHVKMTVDMADPALYERVIAALIAPMRAISV